MRHVARQRVQNGILQCGGAVTVEEMEQPDRDCAEIGAALGGAHDQGLASGRGLQEAIGAAVLACRVLMVDQFLD